MVILVNKIQGHAART